MKHGIPLNAFQIFYEEYIGMTTKYISRHSETLTMVVLCVHLTHLCMPVINAD